MSEEDKFVGWNLTAQVSEMKFCIDPLLGDKINPDERQI